MSNHLQPFAKIGKLFALILQCNVFKKFKIRYAVMSNDLQRFLNNSLWFLNPTICSNFKIRFAVISKRFATMEKDIKMILNDFGTISIRFKKYLNNSERFARIFYRLETMHIEFETIFCDITAWYYMRRYGGTLDSFIPTIFKQVFNHPWSQCNKIDIIT